MSEPGRVVVNVVDLFCGCGGLSLGFDEYRGDIEYRVVLALDNDAKTIACYNTNFSGAGGKPNTAIVSDLTWFGHPAEIVLYYLNRYAAVVGDDTLRQALDSDPACFPGFLQTVRSIDSDFSRQCQQLSSTAGYRSALEDIDRATFGLATCIAFFARQGLGVPRLNGIDPLPLLWSHEAKSLVEPSNVPACTPPSTQLMSEVRTGLERQWERELGMLADSAEKTGRGQNRPVPERLKALVKFLRGPVGRQLREAWLEWRVRRDSTRLDFVLHNESFFLSLYHGDRSVRLLLGGPPCKGFSRIGRARIANLRDQGVHAWIDSEYGDQRNALLHKYVLFLEALRPNVFIFENVRHFESALKTPNGTLDAAARLEEAIEAISGVIHYVVQSKVVRAREHAIPQDRERFFMIGLHRALGDEDQARSILELETFKDEVPLATALHGLGPAGEFRFGDVTSCATSYESRAYTVSDTSMPLAHVEYLRWIRQPAPGSENPPTQTDAHIYRQPRPDDLGLYETFAPGKRWMDYKLTRSETYKELRLVLKAVRDALKTGALKNIKDGKALPALADVERLYEKVNPGLLLRLMLEEVEMPAWFGEENHLLLDCYLDRGTDQHGDWFERLAATKPCKTIVAHIGKDTYGYIHPWEPRPISIREAARIQSFPDWYSFGGVGVVEGYAMIGNAVPPLLGHLFAKRLAELHATAQVFSEPDPTKARHQPSSLERALQQSLWELAASKSAHQDVTAD